MASTIDFSTLGNDELIYGYKRVNRSRFPDNFVECADEIKRRGLSLPERFEISAIGEDSALFERLGDGLTTVASVFGRRPPSANA